MAEDLNTRKQTLKKLLLASMLLQYEDYVNSCDLIDEMDESQLDKSEASFLRAMKRKENVMKRLFDKNPSLPYKLNKLGEKLGRQSKVSKVASFGRDVLKNTIKK